MATVRSATRGDCLRFRQNHSQRQRGCDRTLEVLLGIEYWMPIPMVSAKKDQQEIQGQLERSQMGGVEHTGEREVESLLLFSFIHRGLSRDEERKRYRAMILCASRKIA